MSSPAKRPIGKTARNEQRKLVANTLNAIGVAVFGLGALTPVLNGVTSERSVQIVVCKVILWAAHWWCARDPLLGEGLSMDPTHVVIGILTAYGAGLFIWQLLRERRWAAEEERDRRGAGPTPAE